MKRNKQGVSLIVLVITIIVMIILAASVIISLSNNGIINRANEAVNATNLAEVQHLASLAWSEAYLENMNLPEEERDAKIKAAVEAAFAENNLNAADYDLTYGAGGVTVGLKGNTSNVPEEWKASVSEVTADGVPIPKGFVKSPHQDEDEKNEGLVIYALREEEIGIKTELTMAEYEAALTDRNQFVWVPVDNFKDFKRENFGMSYTISPTLGTDWWELVLDTATNMPSQTLNTTNYVSVDTLNEARAMYASVEKYGGFYIARYEVGADGVNSSNYGRGNLSITMGKYPYNRGAWGTSMTDDTSGVRALSLSRSFYPETNTKYGVVSTLTYGVQWDRTLSWWQEIDSSINLTNSISYGIYCDTVITDTDEYNKDAQYSNGGEEAWTVVATKSTGAYWLMTTGAWKKASVNNIYDMAGNLWEWTMGGYSTNSRVARGGGFDSSSSSSPVAFRFDYGSVDADVFNGFRPSLYIK